MTQDEFTAKCRELCPRCADGVIVRFRADSQEWVHDWDFGGVDPKTGRRAGMGHGICLANEFRKQHG